MVLIEKETTRNSNSQRCGPKISKKANPPIYRGTRIINGIKFVGKVYEKRFQIGFPASV